MSKCEYYETQTREIHYLGAKVLSCKVHENNCPYQNIKKVRIAGEDNEETQLCASNGLSKHVETKSFSEGEIISPKRYNPKKLEKSNLLEILNQINEK